jgi:hypothetical protein
MTMPDFEKLGSFYLGKRHDAGSETLTDELVLYDSKDLTTHAVIIGMTGSGKTGLGIGLLEEAALDHIPVIAIDPKGDMGNLLLTFPKLTADDFRPWVNPRGASDQGQTVEEYAAAQAALWKKGLGEWGQSGERIARLRESADMAIYTPGSNAGLPVSVLKSFAAPEAGLMGDIDLYRDRVQATATGILTLLGIDADPVASREHILISRLLDHAWQEGRELDIAALIAAIQNPPCFANVLRIHAPERDHRLDACPARHLQPACDPVHGRDIRIHAAGSQSAFQVPLPDPAETGARIWSRTGTRYAEPGGP